MEQLIPANDNTVAQGFFTFSTNREVLTDSHRLALLQTLLAATDTQSLINDFFQELQCWLAIESVELISAESSVRSGRPRPSLRYLDFPCEESTQSECSLRYGVLEPLSVWQRSLLGVLHETVRLPLQHMLQQERLKHLARRDHLTGLGNRAHFDDSINTFMHRAERDGKAFGLLVLDLDKFKQINDTHGHCEGDTVLVALASAIRVSLRGTDQAFRLGGDEFCCLVDDDKAATLESVAERIRHNMQSQPILSKHKLTCSIGFSLLSDDDDARRLLHRADKALYREKHR
ncbi:putative signaling protein [Saliniradius amylolyticus]|uniref:diguanylate cyclase n=1 Tax=Saliniradius amylolyticus TaxID=2183582 RepID=A0A2S2E4M1_9ALTE|nr:GGDEF domain-containing protein [Saliniradius amylolyticus]AWL12594.1 putative signaling protein [Saliniradius amylolyticus]